tara:strand:- start:666 stop:779 length:114 start_codon:yes stop_codon:yes gene_type:complete
MKNYSDILDFWTTTTTFGTAPFTYIYVEIENIIQIKH